MRNQLKLSISGVANSLGCVALTRNVLSESRVAPRVRITLQIKRGNVYMYRTGFSRMTRFQRAR